MSETLKPCEVCKHEASMQYHCGVYYVECDECGDQGALHWTEAEAIAAWNRRPEQPADLVERAKQALLDVRILLADKDMPEEWFADKFARAALAALPPAEQERARIVAMLRRFADTAEQIAGDIGYGAIRPPASCYRYAADAIERGDHQENDDASNSS